MRRSVRQQTIKRRALQSKVNLTIINDEDVPPILDLEEHQVKPIKEKSVCLKKSVSVQTNFPCATCHTYTKCDVATNTHFQANVNQSSDNTSCYCGVSYDYFKIYNVSLKDEITVIIRDQSTKSQVSGNTDEILASKFGNVLAQCFK